MKRSMFALSLLVVPSFSFAARTAKDLVGEAISLISDLLIPLLIAFALFYFMWGVVDFIRHADNSDAREKGKIRMIWGILALFLMIAFLGVTSIFTRTLFNESPILPILYENK